LADYLAGGTDARGETGPRWDLLEINGVDAQDGPVSRLVGHLVDRGCTVDSRGGMNCWRIELPPTWDEYLGMLSKSHRKQIRCLERQMFQSGRAALRTVRCQNELSHSVDILAYLHQRRRQSLGEPGRFASDRFAAFHRDVMPMMLAAGRLQLHWLEIDGRPVAAEYHLTGEGITYAYQSGIDPEFIECEPGRLITMATLKQAIEQGGRAMDFLRGDEPYKAHFRASPRPGLATRIVPPRAAARWRNGLWLAGRRVKHWIESVSPLPQAGEGNSVGAAR
jgi:hypothetical protein